MYRLHHQGEKNQRGRNNLAVSFTLMLEPVLSSETSILIRAINKPSGSVKRQEIVEEVSNWWFLKKGSSASN
jgi:hypothetical protein